ncbi:MAG: HU family DNA-binding protein [Candidatus Woesearchaeota archaeon]|nr:MAG: HU family DNA-binding protein [Candidatus Woesearchaeota archaeon]
MNKAELIEVVAKDTGLSKAQTGVVLNSIMDAIKKAVRKDPVQLIGLGTFKVVKRKARMGINPQTKEKIKIPARKAVKFTPSAELKNI